jgi:UDP-N-acetylmuramate--alanine ligase
LFIVFQPHLFSRTKLLLVRLAESLRAADQVFVTDIYAARERPDPTINSQMLVTAIGERAQHVANQDTLVDQILAQTTTGDIIVLMGAGDIYRLAERLV